MVRILADVVGAAAVVPLTTDRTKIAAGWVIVAITGGPARLGDSTTLIGKGIPIPANGSVTLPAASDINGDSYVLADLFMYLPGGCIASVSYRE
jgi:hypothetical protein